MCEGVGGYLASCVRGLLVIVYSLKGRPDDDDIWAEIDCMLVCV